MAPTVPHIPQEIITLIVQELSVEKTTLQSCSVVSSSFRDVAQAELFRSIAINLDPEDVERNERFHSILTTYPRIGSYVQSLDLRLPDPEEADLFSAFLPMLTSVRDLYLVRVGNVQGDWASFSNPFKAAVLQLLWLPSLDQLELNYPDFPFPYLRFCTNLKHLVLLNRLYNNRLTVEDTPEPALLPLLSAVGLPNQGARQGHLESLNMGNWVALKKFLAAAQHPTSTLSLSRLESFDGHVSQAEDLTQIQNLLALCRPSLRRLSFHVSLSASASPYPTPSLQALPKLGHLHFLIKYMQAAHSSDWMCRLLEAIPAPNVINTIVITAPLLRDVKAVDWARVDVLLTRERHNKTLTQVLVSVPGTMELSVLEKMPRLDKKETVYFLK